VILGADLFELLKCGFMTARWAGLQVVATSGLMVLVSALLPAVQADLSD
jgi:hypothetical protein